jgi:hypothetical protein
MSGQSEKEGEPLESLVRHIGSGEISIGEALKSVEAAELAIYAELDDMTFSLMGSLDLSDKRFAFGISDFYNLHRSVYEFDEMMGVPSVEVARLCLRAAKRIQFVTGEFSFQNAIAFRLEQAGQRGEAYQHYWAGRSLVDQQAKEVQTGSGGQPQLFKGLPILLEPPTRFYPSDEGSVTKQVREILHRAIARGKLTGDPVSEFYGWRGLGYIECKVGNPSAAVQMYTEAIRSAKKVLGPVPLLLLHGDRLWAAFHAKEDNKILKKMAEELGDVAEKVPPYLASHAPLIRATYQCKAAGDTSTEEHCREAAARCLAQ